MTLDRADPVFQETLAEGHLTPLTLGTGSALLLKKALKASQTDIRITLQSYTPHMTLHAAESSRCHLSVVFSVQRDVLAILLSSACAG